MVLHVFDHDRFGKHDIIGEVRIPVKEVNFGESPVDLWRDITTAIKVCSSIVLKSNF